MLNSAKSQMPLIGVCSTLILAAHVAPQPAAAQGQITKSQLYFELNATDGDIGLHGLIDADSWSEAKISGPAGAFDVLRVSANDASVKFGANEVFFESNEPSLKVRPFSELLTLFPPGAYQFLVKTTANERITARAELTTVVPCPPMILPTRISGGDLVVRWRVKQGVYNPDTSVCDTSKPITLVKAKVSVQLTSKMTGATRVVDIDMPPAARLVETPDQFLAGFDPAKTEVKVTVNLSEAGGNRTSSETELDL